MSAVSCFYLKINDVFQKSPPFNFSPCFIVERFFLLCFILLRQLKLLQVAKNALSLLVAADSCDLFPFNRALAAAAAREISHAQDDCDTSGNLPHLLSGLWSRNSNFRLRQQLQNYLVHWKLGKHCIICTTRSPHKPWLWNRNPNFRLRLQSSKSLCAPSACPGWSWNTPLLYIFNPNVNGLLFLKNKRASYLFACKKSEHGPCCCVSLWEAYARDFNRRSYLCTGTPESGGHCHPLPFNKGVNGWGGTFSWQYHR